MDKSFFTIGQIAAMTGISTQTLRHYDRIGLFRPVFTDPENHYRFYTSYQLMILNVITGLKDMGFSLPEIKTYLEVEDLNLILNLLTKQKMKIKNEIQKLHRKEKHLQHLIENLNIGISQDAHASVKIKNLPKRFVVYKAIDSRSTMNDVIFTINQLMEISKKNRWEVFGKPILIHYAPLAIRGEAGYRLDICLSVRGNPENMEFTKVIPGGKYASVYHKGPYDRLQCSHELLYHWIENNHFKVNGNPLSVFIIDISITQNHNHFISEIQVPIEKK